MRTVIALAFVAGCGRVGFGLGEPSDATANDDSVVVDDGPLQSGLLLHFPFEDTASGAVDIARGHDATCTNCPTSTAGKIGNAYAFAANQQQHLVIANAPDLRDLDAFTVGFWLRSRTLTAGGASGITKVYQTATANSFDLGTYTNNVPAICTSGGMPVVDYCDRVLTPVVDNVWTHLAATFDGSVVTLYIDGQFALANPRSILWDDSPIRIGCDLENTFLTACLDGDLDDVRLYGRSLPASEIAALAQ